MNKIQRNQILDYQSYDDKRSEIQKSIFEIKGPRRIHVGSYLTFLFENVDTLSYQVQEMMRVEKLVKEKDIQHEIDTYNELLGGPGSLSATLLIEIDDVEQRKELLTEWIDLPHKIYILCSDQSKVYAKFDHRQIGDSRLSSVQYLMFELEDKAPIAIGSDHPDVTVESHFTDEQLKALTQDLEASKSL
ncbi:MAG: DUF3501 family protein [Bdellovibrionales bacterium]|nr:DUF3501 family protein [Bdellovibrionales bacterium]